MLAYQFESSIVMQWNHVSFKTATNSGYQRLDGRVGGRLRELVGPSPKFWGVFCFSLDNDGLRALHDRFQ